MEDDLARFGVGFEGINHSLRAITIEEKLACDNTITELAFVQRVMFIRRAPQNEKVYKTVQREH